MFKPGDKVICIDNTNFNELEYGKIYIVIGHHPYTKNEIILKELERFGSWSPKRFRPANAHLIKKRLGII